MVVFKEISFDNKEHYIINFCEKLYESKLKQEEVQGFMNAMNSKAKDLQVETQLSNFEETPEIRKRKACALNTLRSADILLPNEIVETNTFSFLTKAYGGNPKGTPVLHRKTNLAEYYLMYKIYRFDGADIDLEPSQKLPDIEERPMLLGSMAASAGVFLLKTLGRSLVKKLESKLFPGPDKFEKLYNKLTDYFEKSEIETIQKNINEHAVWLSSNYITAKESYLKNYNKGFNDEVKIHESDLKKRQEDLQKDITTLYNKWLKNKTSFSYKFRYPLSVYISLILMRIIMLKEQAFWKYIILTNNGKNGITGNSIVDLVETNEAAAIAPKKYLETVKKELKDIRYAYIKNVRKYSEKVETHEGTEWATGYIWKDLLDIEDNEGDPQCPREIMSKKELNKRMYGQFEYSGSQETAEDAERKAQKTYDEHLETVNQIYNTETEEPLSTVIEVLQKAVKGENNNTGGIISEYLKEEFKV